MGVPEQLDIKCAKLSPPLASGHSLECQSRPTHCQISACHPVPRISWGSHISPSPINYYLKYLSFFPQEDGKFLRMCQDDTFYLPRCLPKKQGFSIPETQVITILSLASCVSF